MSTQAFQPPSLTLSPKQIEGLRDSLNLLRDDTHAIVPDFLDVGQADQLIAAAETLRHWSPQRPPRHLYDTVVTDVRTEQPRPIPRRLFSLAWRGHYRVPPVFDELGQQLGSVGEAPSLPTEHFVPNTLAINRLRPDGYIGLHVDQRDRLGAVAVVSLGPALLDIEDVDGHLITHQTFKGSLEVIAGRDTARRYRYTQPVHSVRTVAGMMGTRYSLAYSMTSKP